MLLLPVLVDGEPQWRIPHGAFLGNPPMVFEVVNTSGLPVRVISAWYGVTHAG